METVTRRLPELVRTDNECDDATRRLNASRASAQPAWHTTAPSSARPPRTLQHGFPTAAAALTPVNASTAAFHPMIRNSWSRTKSGSPDRYCCSCVTSTESDTESARRLDWFGAKSPAVGGCVPPLRRLRGQGRPLRHRARRTQQRGTLTPLSVRYLRTVVIGTGTYRMTLKFARGRVGAAASPRRIPARPETARPACSRRRSQVRVPSI